MLLPAVLFTAPAPADVLERAASRTVTVSPAATPESSGRLLLEALEELDPAPSADNRWLVRLDPGSYDLGGQTLELRPYVDVEGSGRGSTVILGSGPPLGPGGTIAPMIAGAAPVELRGLTVSCRPAASASCMAIENGPAADAVYRDLRIETRGDGGAFWGMRNIGASPILDDVVIEVGEGREGWGVVNADFDNVIPSRPVLRRTLITVTADCGAGTRCMAGILDRGGSFPRSVTDSVIVAEGTAFAAGVDHVGAAPEGLVSVYERSRVVASAQEAYGIVGAGYSLRILHSTVEARGAFSVGVAVEGGDHSSVEILHSEVGGEEFIVRAVTLDVAATMLRGGGAVLATGSLACASVVDDLYRFYPQSCPGAISP